jgi:hypothetical protein
MKQKENAAETYCPANRRVPGPGSIREKVKRLTGEGFNDSRWF